MAPEIVLPAEYRSTPGGGELYSEIEIRSSPERIWKIFTDFPRYPEWNPFIRSIRGDLAIGGQITAELRPPGSAGMTIRPVLLKVDPLRELRWKGHLFFSGLFDGEHVFEIRPEGAGRCRFVQREIFSGLLLSLFTRMLKNGTARGFADMNAALKERAEGTIPA
jgi:hypothetical protein